VAWCSVCDSPWLGHADIPGRRRSMRCECLPHTSHAIMRCEGSKEGSKEGTSHDAFMRGRTISVVGTCDQAKFAAIFS
jgi:hypothetical protein